MKLWDKGYSIDDQIEKFTVGNDREVDIHIAKYDIQASLAHAKMLHSINILNDEEIQVEEIVHGSGAIPNVCTGRSIV